MPTMPIGFGDGEVEVGRGDGVHAAEDLFVFVRPAGEVDDAFDGGADFLRFDCVNMRAISAARASSISARR